MESKLFKLVAPIHYLVLVVSIFLSAAVYSSDNRTSDIKTESQRAEFLKLEKRVWNTSNEDFARLAMKLDDYPLVPYLVEQKILHGLSTRKVEQVRSFLREYQDEPLQRRMLHPWLSYLAKKNRKKLFMEFYKPLGDTKLDCQYLSYQLEDSVSKDLVYPQVAALWNVSQSQPKDCDQLFKKWKVDGQLSNELILQRIGKVANGGNLSLIKYLRTLLPDDKRYVADLWHKIRRAPENVKRLQDFKGNYPDIETEIITYGLEGLAWRDISSALQVWESAQQQFSFSEKQKARITNRFAVSMAIAKHEDAEFWLSKSEILEQDAEVLRWHLAMLLKTQNWPSVISLIEKASTSLTGENEYQYWLARSYEATGNHEKAEMLYNQLASERNYYGFLSSARLEKSFNFQDHPLVIEQAVIDKITSMPSAKRALELKELERFHEARREWRFVQDQLEYDEKLASAVIASQWGWHDQAIFTFAESGYLNDVNRRFPMAYEEELTIEANRNQIDPEWAFAIARRESSFMTDAVSTANAFGLMQVLPSTAKYLERERVSNRSLMNPKTNAMLGNKYLRYLMDKVGNNMVLATASYNAGWSRVKGWLPEDASVGADLWVETIPYKETRNYVKAVMAYKQIYQNKLIDVSDPQLPKQIKDSVFGELVMMQIPTSVAD